MLPITVSFTPTTDEWRETLRACRFDQRMNRMCLAWFVVVGLAVVAGACELLIPAVNGQLIAGITMLGAAAWIIVSRLWPFRSRRLPGGGSEPAVHRTLSFTPASIDYRSGENSVVLAYSSLRYSETKNLFVLYLLSNAFGFLPGGLRSRLPGFVLMCSGRVQLIPVPKRSFECIPDKNNLRDLLQTYSRPA